MNIYKFINSIDVMKYLEEINYQFTPAESAYVIFNSRRTLEDKCNLLSQLVKETEDFYLPEYKMNFHKYLLDYVNWVQKMLGRFKECEEGFVYSFSVFYKKGFECDSFCDSPCCFFKTYNDCAKAVKKVLASNLIWRVFIRKSSVNCSEENHKYIEVEFSEGFGEISIYSHDGDEDSESWIESTFMYYPFDKVWVGIPVPFKKGDIVCNVFSNNLPMVYKGKDTDKEDTETEEEYANRIKMMHSRNTNTSLPKNVIWYTSYKISNHDCRFFECQSSSFIDIEYYRGELNGAQKMLREISKYLKGEIDAMGLLQYSLKSYRNAVIEQFCKHDDWK